MWPPRSRASVGAAVPLPAAPGPGWMWRHRPIGRGLMTLAIGLLAGPALLLDAAAPAAGGTLVVWHALSTAALAGFGLWALWTPQLPRNTGQAMARGTGLLVLGALAAAAQRLPAAEASALLSGLYAVAVLASALFIIGTHWARREIHW